MTLEQHRRSLGDTVNSKISVEKWTIEARTHATTSMPIEAFRALVVPHAAKVLHLHIFCIFSTMTIISSNPFLLAYEHGPHAACITHPQCVRRKSIQTCRPSITRRSRAMPITPTLPAASASGSLEPTCPQNRSRCPNNSTAQCLGSRICNSHCSLNATKQRIGSKSDSEKRAELLSAEETLR